MINEPTQRFVSREAWTEQRIELLAQEKAHTREGDRLTAMRQALPWVLMDDDYHFADTDGVRRLSELFDGRRQLGVYHFMFGPDWDAGCEKCSFWADQFDAMRVHLAQRDTTLIAISNTSPHNIATYKRRMGWSFPWWSSLDTTFGTDFNTTLDAKEIETGDAYYNYKHQHFFWTEAQGFSVFYRLDDDRVAHTYSTYGRGIDAFNSTYNMLDLTPIGRNEQYPFDWLKRHDEYPTDGRTTSEPLISP